MNCNKESFGIISAEVAGGVVVGAWVGVFFFRGEKKKGRKKGDYSLLSSSLQHQEEEEFWTYCPDFVIEFHETYKCPSGFFRKGEDERSDIYRVERIGVESGLMNAPSI